MHYMTVVSLEMSDEPKNKCIKRGLIPIKERGSNGKENNTIKGRNNEVSKHLR